MVKLQHCSLQIFVIMEFLNESLIRRFTDVTIALALEWNKSKNVKKHKALANTTNRNIWQKPTF